MAMKIKSLKGNADRIVYGGSWISPKRNNGDWDYWYVISLLNMDDELGSDNEGNPKYRADIYAVSPTAAGQEKLDSAIQSCGVDATVPMTDERKVEVLATYGIRACLHTITGNNVRKMLSAARKMLDTLDMMFGAYMDKHQNRMGHTGWDVIRGDLSVETALKNVKKG